MPVPSFDISHEYTHKHTQAQMQTYKYTKTHTDTGTVLTKVIFAISKKESTGSDVSRETPINYTKADFTFLVF